MRRTVVLTADEIVTLNLLARLNNEILLEGLTKDGLEELLLLQSELLSIIQKANR